MNSVTSRNHNTAGGTIDCLDVESRGIRLSCERTGAGPVVVWGHGLTSSRRDEDDLPLIDHDRLAAIAEVIRVDAVGHGLSDDPVNHDRFGWADMARDVLAVADALGVERFVASGASMGAATALHLAILAPERVSGLALVIPPTAWATRAAQVDRYLASADAIADGRIDEVIAVAATVAPPDPVADIWHARGATRLRAADPARTAAALRGAAHCDLPPVEVLAGIDVPVTICAWTGDVGHPMSTAQILHDAIDSSQLVTATTPDDLDTWTDAVIELVNRVA